MQIFIHKDGQQQGPFDRATVEAGIIAGRFTKADLGWYEGAADWIPLSELLKAAPAQETKDAAWSIPGIKTFLICVSGPDQGKRAQLTEGVLVLGRSSQCNILSDDPEVLDEHIRFSFQNKVCRVETVDGSKVFIDGVSVLKGPLAPKQQIRIGRSLWQIQSGLDIKREASALLGKVVDGISSAAGVESVEKLEGREFISSIFKKRTDDDIDEFFTKGTRSTTPALSEIDTHWPKPWAFSRAFIAALVLFGGFLWGLFHYHNPKLVPGLILTGSFGIPFATLIFFVEMNAPRNVSLYQVLRLVFLGGIASLLLTLSLGAFVPSDEGWLWALATGMVEETAKILTVTRLIKSRRYSWTLNGLLFGAAVGTGFAAFESAGYVLEHWVLDLIQAANGRETNSMMWTIGLRAFLSPFGHIIWTGLAAAALWKVKGKRPFKWEMLQDPRFIRVFVLVVLLHAVWDMPFGIPLFGAEWGFLGKCVVLGVIGWIIVLGYIQDGLKQIRKAQEDEKGKTQDSAALPSTGLTIVEEPAL